MSMYDRGDGLDELSLGDSDAAHGANHDTRYVGSLQPNTHYSDHQARSIGSRSRSRSPGPHNIGARLEGATSPFVSLQSASVTELIPGGTLDRRTRDTTDLLQEPSISLRYPDEVFVNPIYEDDRPPTTVIYRVH